MNNLIEPDGMKPGMYQDAMQDHLRDDEGLKMPEMVRIACPNCPYPFAVMPNLRPTHICRCSMCGFSAPRSRFRTLS